MVALLLGMVVTSVLLGFFEGGFYALNKHKIRGENVVYSVSQTYWQSDPVVGKRLIPDMAATQTKTRQGEPVFSAMYTMDHFGRRATPRPPGAPAPDRFALFFGCSFTFGTGVTDEQTIPAQFAADAPRFHAYNYGNQGFGPNNCLAQLETIHLKTEVEESQGVGLFIFIPDHVRRVIGAKKVVCQWVDGSNNPCYEFAQDGAVAYRGPFRTAHPWRLSFYKALMYEQCLSYFEVEVPPWPRPADIRLTAAILAAAKAKFLEQFPGSRFYVVVYPDHPKLKPQTFPAAEMLPYLKEAGVEYLDYSSAMDLSQPGMLIVNDGHPAAPADAAFATLLARDISE